MQLKGVAALSELADLHLVILKVETLSFGVTRHDAQRLHLLRQPLDLDGLEHHHEV
jgi:hypothetical protein